jgi:membrane fusion protein (multidrug efflux system)
LNGTVDSLAPDSGITFSPIPPDNATGNFTKVVQRLAVKIRFARGQSLLEHLRVGMSVEAAVDMETSTVAQAPITPGTPNHVAAR